MGHYLKFTAMALAFALVSSAFPAHASSDDYLSDIQLAEDEWLVLASEQSRDGVHSQLMLQPGSVAIGEKRGDWIQCKSAEDPTCSSTVALKSIIAWSVLPYCDASDSEICIESFLLGRRDEGLVPATYVAEAPQRQDFPASPSKNLLPGTGIPLFESSSISNQAGTRQYAVMIRVTQFWDAKKRLFVAHQVEAEILPYFTAGAGTSGACMFTVDSQCARPTDFLPDTKVSLTFRVPNSIGGWFSGRMKDPSINVSAFNKKTNLISVTSEPVEVAAMGLVKKRSDFTPLEDNWAEGNGKWRSNGGWATGPNGSQPNIFSFIENYRSQTKDTALGSNLIWKMKTTGAGSGSSCLADTSKVLGIVTTNAIGYDAMSPTFKNGFLEYKVAGVHYMPNGQDLVVGTYDLVMRSDTARCLYRFSKAPLSATVTVTGGAEKNIATTVVSEKNGWLKMAAYGFTFSKKTIKVKVTKKKK